ncbi:unnamed protein product, partial [Rotaria sp. Silwood2]
EDDSQEEKDEYVGGCCHTESTINQLPNNVRLILTTMKKCKSLSGLNRQLQLVQSEPEIGDQDNSVDKNKSNEGRTLHRSSIRRAAQLLENMFIMEEEYIIGAFLHPNYEQMRRATSSQIEGCYAKCRQSLIHDPLGADIIVDNYEAEAKKPKLFMSTLRDNQDERNQDGHDEVDDDISLTLGEDEQYSNPLIFGKKRKIN